VLFRSSDQLTSITVEIDALPTTSHNATFYTDITEAVNHKLTLESTILEIENTNNSTDPYQDQIVELTDGIRDAPYDTINALSLFADHQEFMLKLLTNKDSFVRKKIIDKNLNFLNNRLSLYLSKIGLPHSVKFLPDLDVEITEYGRELDFDNLSRGERTRLMLALSWAFRDVYEVLNAPINLLFVDELIDTGLDPSGVEASLRVLKEMSRSSKKSIFIVSHRDELIGRVNSVFKVIKEGGFTSFSQG